MKNVYCLYSLDNKRIIKARKEIIKEANVDEFNVSVFDLDNTPLDVAIKDAYSVPFMAEYRVVVLSNATFLAKSTKSKDDEDSINKGADYPALTEYLKNPVGSTILIIECARDQLDSKKESVKIIKEKRYDNELKLPDKPLIIKYIDDLMKEKGYTLKTDAREELIKRVGDDPLNYEGEIEKLLLYMEGAKSKTITIQTIDGLITDSENANIFELMNALLDNDKKKALEIYYSLMDQNYEPLQILGFLIKRFSQILYCKEMLLSRTSKEDIAKLLGVSSGQAYYISKNARDIDYKKLSRCLNNLKELDYSTKVDFKYGKDDATGFELFLLKQ